MNPATPQLNTTPVGGNPFLAGGQGYSVNQAAQNQPSFLDGIKDFIKNMDLQMRNTPNAFQLAEQFDVQRAENMYGSGIASALKSYTDMLKAQTPTTALKEQPNSLVGNEMSASPDFVVNHQISQLLQTSDPNKIAAFMGAKGYVSSYQAGIGMVWVKGAEGAGAQEMSAAQGAIDERGRPEYVDPTMLEPGERMINAQGVGFTGGTDYTNAAGTTVSQYAVTLPDNIGSDPKGRYKWVSSVSQDADGNWKRVYRRQLRKVHTRSHRKKQQARAEEAAMQENQNSGGGIERNQLVNLRIDFG